MNIRNFRGKDLIPGEEDTKIIKWWKKFQINYGPILYEFNSISEFDDYSLDGRIKRLCGISLSYLQVDSIWKEKDDPQINIILRDGTKNLTFEKLYPGPYSEFGVNQKCWLELNKLKDGDELSMLRFFYRNHSYYQLFDLERKSGNENPKSRGNAPRNEGGGQSIEDLIAEVSKQPINKQMVEIYKR